jgi:hypothetical protein
MRDYVIGIHFWGTYVNVLICLCIPFAEVCHKLTGFASLCFLSFPALCLSLVPWKVFLAFLDVSPCYTLKLGFGFLWDAPAYKLR